MARSIILIAHAVPVGKSFAPGRSARGKERRPDLMLLLTFFSRAKHSRATRPPDSSAAISRTMSCFRRHVCFSLAHLVHYASAYRQPTAESARLFGLSLISMLTKGSFSGSNIPLIYRPQIKKQKGSSHYQHWLRLLGLFLPLRRHCFPLRYYFRYFRRLFR